MQLNNLAISELGKQSSYDKQYHPERLLAIPRSSKRTEIGIKDKAALPFFGADIWNHYEVSWLNEKGKPVVAVAEIIYSCESTYIIESKSMKLYFNSLNQTVFKDAQAVETVVKRDLQQRLETPFLKVQITPADGFESGMYVPGLAGFCLDTLDIACSVYSNDPSFLQTEDQQVEEIVYSNLLKSNCLVTNQPDWCSVQIAYKGNKINHEGLLRYLVSFRNDNEFHEPCIEKIFMHLLERCQPDILTVYGRSTRRGGIDINAYRSTEQKEMENTRLFRQ